MKKIFILITCALCLSACSAKKPDLEPTQIVNGKSIILPPDFYILPKAKNASASEMQQTEE